MDAFDSAEIEWQGVLEPEALDTRDGDLQTITVYRSLLNPAQDWRTDPVGQSICTALEYTKMGPGVKTEKSVAQYNVFFHVALLEVTGQGIFMSMSMQINAAASAGAL